MLPEEYKYNETLLTSLKESVKEKPTLKIPNGYSINPRNPFRRLNHGNGILNPTYLTTMRLNDYIPPPKLEPSPTKDHVYIKLL